MELVIKRLTVNDITLAKEFFHFLQVDDGVTNPTSASDEYLQRLLSRNDFYVLVALVDQEFAGGLTAYELPMYKQEISELFLYEIAVKLAFRQKGIAKALIEALKQIGQQQAIEVIYVGTELDNIRAQKLYAATGGKREDIAWYTYGE